MLRWNMIRVLAAACIICGVTTAATTNLTACIDSPVRVVRIGYDDSIDGLRPAEVDTDGSEPYLVTAFRIASPDTLYVMTDGPSGARVLVYDVSADTAAWRRSCVLPSGRAYSDFLIWDERLVLAYDEFSSQSRCGYMVVHPTRGTFTSTLPQGATTRAGQTWSVQSPGSLRLVAGACWAYNAPQSMSVSLGELEGAEAPRALEAVDGVPTEQGVITKDALHVYRDGTAIIEFDYRSAEGVDDVCADGTIVTREAVAPCCDREVCRRYRIYDGNGTLRRTITVPVPQSRPYAILRGQDHRYDNVGLWILRLGGESATLSLY